MLTKGLMGCILVLPFFKKEVNRVIETGKQGWGKIYTPS